MTSSVVGPALVTYVGDITEGPASAMVAATHRAIARDLVTTAQRSGVFERVIVVTDSPELAASLPSDVLIERSDRSFHFGRHLRELVARHRLRRPMYVSRGALPLLSVDAIAELANRLRAADALVLSNNPYSADLVAWTPGDSIARIPPPPVDNSLARALERQAGLPAEAMPRDAISQFDVDTPTDLLALALHPNTGPTTRRVIEALELPTDTHRAAMARFTRSDSQVILAGRVSSAVWAHLERDSACRVRVFAEERGMKADGREETGQVRSLLGMLIDAVGPTSAFASLAELGDSAYLDSRVLFAHARLSLTVEDRFQSDLGAWQSVTNPIARAITRAASEAPIPVVMGGHSLMSGGLYVLCDAAWREHDTRNASTRA